MTTTQTTALIATIRTAMQTQGVTQVQLAERIGTSPGTMHRYLHGHVQPGAAVLQRMLDALGMDAGKMLEPRASG